MPDGRPGSLCVFCRRQRVVEAWQPFCSERCKLQDLARWAEGTYRVAGDAVTDENDKSEGKRDNETDSDF